MSKTDFETQKELDEMAHRIGVVGGGRIGNEKIPFQSRRQFKLAGNWGNSQVDIVDDDEADQLISEGKIVEIF